MTPKIHIVSHVYAVELPQYAVFLRAQLSSLVLNKPDVGFRITICLSADDDRSMSVVNELKAFLDEGLDVLKLSKGELFRRCIGRNIVARSTECDLIWYTDVDHLFGRGCLDHLWSIWSGIEKDVIMVWPREILVQHDLEKADLFWRWYVDSKDVFIGPDYSDFRPKTYYKAIGGVQIVRGDFARKHGYIKDNKRWQSPVDPSKPFPSFRDDVKFRRFCESVGIVIPIDLKGLYRLRHTRTTYQPMTVM